MSKWHLIENQPLLREIYKDPPLFSYRRGRSLEKLMFSLEQSFAGQSFLSLTDRSHFWPVNHLNHQTGRTYSWQRDCKEDLRRKRTLGEKGF